MPRLLFIFAVLLFTARARAEAESVVVTIDASAAPTLLQAVSGAVIDQLTEGGFQARVLPAADVLMGVACSDSLCSRELLHRTNSALLVNVTLHGTARGIEAIVATVFDSTEQSFVATSNVTASRDVATTAKLAVAQALLRRVRGPGVTLSVRDIPDGSVIELDGTEVGLSPWEGPVDPGHHRIAAVIVGERYTREIDISEDQTGTLAITFERTQGPRGDATEVHRPVVGPSILGLLGIAGVTAGAVGIMLDDCQGDRISGQCAGPGVTTNWTAVGIYGGGGLAAIAGAVLWYFLGSEEVRVTSMPGVSTGLVVSGDL
jgi:hypothetical protein